MKRNIENKINKERLVNSISKTIGRNEIFTYSYQKSKIIKSYLK